MHFWLHNTAHCAETIVSMHLCTGSGLAERVGQGEVGWEVKVMVGTGWATSSPDCMERLKNIVFTL